MDALVILVREPRPGHVKSRLARDISDRRAAALYRAFIIDTLRACERLEGVARIIAYTPSGAGEAIGGLSGDAWRRIPQGEGDLGDRLARAFRRLFDEGMERVIALGSDSPTLPVEHIRRGFLSLLERDVVLGPCLDGGYYLIGLSEADDGVFRSIPWGTPDVLSSTVAAVRRSGRTLAMLPPWYDVDSVAELRMMMAHLEGMRLAGEEVLARETSRSLAALGEGSLLGATEAGAGSLFPAAPA